MPTPNLFFRIYFQKGSSESSIRSINKLRYCGHFKPKIKSLAPSEAEIQDMPFYAILRHLYAIFRYVRHFLNCITSIINKHVYCSHFKHKIKYLVPSVTEIQYYIYAILCLFLAIFIDSSVYFWGVQPLSIVLYG